MSSRLPRGSLNNRGVTALAVVGAIFILSLMGMAVVRMVTITQTTKADHVNYEKAFFVNQAGLEYAVRQIYEGETPVVAEPGRTFGPGSFIIGRQARTLTVTGRVGAAQVIHSVQSPTQADCATLDTSGAQLTGDRDRLQQITFRKICLEEIVLDKMIFSWVPNDDDEELDRIRVAGNTLYDNPPVESGTLLELADYTISNNGIQNVNEVRFTQDMSGKTFTMTVYYGDGSTESSTFVPSG